MRSINDLAAAIHRFLKDLVPLSDDDLASSYIEGAGDRIDLEMRMREIDRRRSSR